VKLCDDRSYFIFPAYGTAFRNMMPWLARWERAFHGEHQFWHGFHGGGILAVPNSIPMQSRYRLATAECHSKRVYGMVLGNEAGMEIANMLACAQEDRPPAMVVNMGLTEPVPDPTVKTTPEHLESLGDERILLVVPRPKRKTLKHLQDLPDWFQTFGVHVEKSSCDVQETFGNAMDDWFSDPGRRKFRFWMSGGEDNAAWQTAVVYYVAEYWDTQVRGLDSVHFVANIEGAPCFRRNWTSNK
jgi:hypothetical protein